jgi:hypothetical protein
MSAPDTNVEKQERRHKAPLLGMKGVVVFAALSLIGFVFYTVLQTEDTSTEAVIDGTATEYTVDGVAPAEATVTDTAPEGADAAVGVPVEESTATE